MLEFIAMMTVSAVIIVGIYVLAHGDWRKFGLKFAGVSLSTAAAIWLMAAQLYIGGVFTCPADMPATACMTFEIYHIIRNVAFLIFHIAIGRDAIQFKKRDRRGALCQKNSLRRPLPL